MQAMYYIEKIVGKENFEGFIKEFKSALQTVEKQNEKSEVDIFVKGGDNLSGISADTFSITKDKYNEYITEEKDYMKDTVSIMTIKINAKDTSNLSTLQTLIEAKKDMLKGIKFIKEKGCNMNNYLKKVLNEIKEKNSNEKEFIQAVNEVLTSLEPVIDKHSEYENIALLERMVETIKESVDRGINEKLKAIDDLVLSILDYRRELENYFKEYKKNLPAHRCLNNARYYGIITSNGNYDKETATPVYDEIKARCNGNFEDTKNYQDIIDRQIEKYYLCLVVGKMEGNGTISIPLYKDESRGMVFKGNIKDGAKEAITKYNVIGTNNEYSLVEVQILTGRTHQIRAHFKEINHPLVGDGKYGDFKINKEFNSEFNYDSQFLHAYKIKFNIGDITL